MPMDFEWPAVCVSAVRFKINAIELMMLRGPYKDGINHASKKPLVDFVVF